MTDISKERCADVVKLLGPRKDGDRLDQAADLILALVAEVERLKGVKVLTFPGPLSAEQLAAFRKLMENERLKVESRDGVTLLADGFRLESEA